ncbi:exonuclease 3'-5' domain-containing protein 2-like isoform X2 [Ostrea edulis]|uniref:exonuclease 3'-5' domain-containing protein 2-like isoform X2 n=1 Tax=Ostrea edulis TaxID=37623 RepID=UPI0024AEEA39|nr:exonuclease 3'-5' domain-containing protein 2-like isoform X2 [Ostrea edulis]
MLFTPKGVPTLCSGMSNKGMGVFLFLQLRRYSVFTSLLRQVRRLLQTSVKYRENKTVHLIKSPKSWEEFYQKIQEQNVIVLGFDCEWVNHGKHICPVSLLQIATSTGDCGLVRLSQMSQIPDSLHRVMEDRSILKVGVASIDDGKKLLKDHGIVVQGCVDLRYVLGRTRGIYNVKNPGLKSIAEEVLGIQLDKQDSVRRSNWEAETYTEDQIEYAAKDALVGVDIFTHLVMAKMAGRKVHISEKALMKNDLDPKFWTTARSMCQGIVDLPFKGQSAKATIKRSCSNGTRPGAIQRLSHALEEQLTKNEEESGNASGDTTKSLKDGRAYVVRQRPLYYNCLLLAPDGEQLCTCDIRKAEWYIEKGLAEKVSDDPLRVRLNFEPQGRPDSQEDYYLQQKDNICVVCGSGEHLIRKQVIPKEYRRFFPTSLKDHASHDVLLLCVPCHQQSTQFDTVLRYQLADESGCPIDMGSSVKVHADKDLQKVRSAARALLSKKERDKIPEARKAELAVIVKDFYGVTDLSDELLQDAADMDYRTINDEYFPHGKGVIRYVRRHGGIYNFERRWRQHFVDTMKPKYLPTNWSVDHKHERSHLYS